MVQPIVSTPAEVIGVNPSVPRQTPKPETGSFSDVLKKGSSALLEALGEATTLLPGGGFVAAAARLGKGMESAGAVAAAASGATLGEDPKAPGTSESSVLPESEFSDLWKLQKEGQLMNMEFLKIQESISRENRTFTTLSNVLKARHETTRNAIGNIR
jgi:hypothetical protein